jgi:ribosomal-protein-alanine N-acetyltransferase
MIARAGPFHMAALATIHAAAFPAGEAWSQALFAGHLSMPGVAAFIHTHGGMVLLRVAADEAEILTLAVAPAARRQGVARALMQAACGHASGAGATRVFLEVAATNTAAAALYATLGFQPVGRRPGYYGPGSDASLLAAPLPAPP